VSPRAGQREAPPSTGFETIVIAVAAGAFGVGAVVFGGAWLATRPSGSVSGDPSDWWSAAMLLAQDPGDPATAWAGRATDLPGPLWYWTATTVVFLATAALVSGVILLWRGGVSSSV
jgi:hypothetical protein